MNPTPTLHVETPAVRLIAHDPYWYEEGNNALALSSIATATFRLVAGKVNGQWSNLGPPGTSGSPTYTEIHAIAIDPAGTKVYFAGNFLNFNGDASADYIVAWDRVTNTWSNIGAANGVVRAMAVDADGYLYVGGDFTVIGGISSPRAIGWNGTTWFALDTGVDGAVHAVAVGADNKIYFGGAFTTASGTTVNRIAAWDKFIPEWQAISDGTVGMNGNVFALAVDPSGFVYAGGAFTNANSVAANRIAVYTATLPDKVWFPLGAGVNADVNVILPKPNGDVYVGGSFTSADGNAIDAIALYNGQTFLPLGLGIDSLPHVRDMALTADGLLWVVGWFSVAGDLQNIGRIATWNGSRWAQIDADLPFVSGPNAVEAIENEIYFGLDASGDGTYGTVAVATNAGSAWAWPVLTIKRTGGDSCQLRKITNETTGARLLLSYNLLDAEELTIDLRPGRRMMHSSFFGTRWKLQPDSDVQEFFLVPGDNDISIYTLEVDGPTVEAHILWRDTYISVD
jgi:hypothetical protein